MSSQGIACAICGGLGAGAQCLCQSLVHLFSMLPPSSYCLLKAGTVGLLETSFPAPILVIIGCS